MYKISKSSLKKLVGVDERLITFIAQLLSVSKYDFSITSGVRTLEEQQALYAQGRTTSGVVCTNCDGVNNKSKHQEGKAVDIALIVNGKTNWDEKYYKEMLSYDEVKELLEFYEVINGGSFKSIKDYPHFEI